MPEGPAARKKRLREKRAWEESKSAPFDQQYARTRVYGRMPYHGDHVVGGGRLKYFERCEVEGVLKATVDIPEMHWIMELRGHEYTPFSRAPLPLPPPFEAVGVSRTCDRCCSGTQEKLGFSH